jgi:hypothetical protein
MKILATVPQDFCEEQMLTEANKGQPKILLLFAFTC